MIRVLILRDVRRRPSRRDIFWRASREEGCDRRWRGWSRKFAGGIKAKESPGQERVFASDVAILEIFGGAVRFLFVKGRRGGLAHPARPLVATMAIGCARAPPWIFNCKKYWYGMRKNEEATTFEKKRKNSYNFKRHL